MEAALFLSLRKSYSFHSALLEAMWVCDLYETEQAGSASEDSIKQSAPHNATSVQNPNANRKAV